MILSGAVTASLIKIGMISFPHRELNCKGISRCIGAAFESLHGEAIGLLILIAVVLLLSVIAAWFLTGMFAGWLAVRHVRILEPGITRRQGWGVAAGWGCGAIVAAIVMIFLLVIFTRAFGL